MPYRKKGPWPATIPCSAELETHDEYGRDRGCFTEQMQGFAAPTRYNQLLASNIEQLTRLQLASANAYAELGLNQLQAVSKVQDAQSLAALGTVQLETASQLFPPDAG